MPLPAFSVNLGSKSLLRYSVWHIMVQMAYGTIGNGTLKVQNDKIFSNFVYLSTCINSDLVHFCMHSGEDTLLTIRYLGRHFPIWVIQWLPHTSIPPSSPVLLEFNSTSRKFNGHHNTQIALFTRLPCMMDLGNSYAWVEGDIEGHLFY